jgi:hypothetical protein
MPPACSLGSGVLSRATTTKTRPVSGSARRELGTTTSNRAWAAASPEPMVGTEASTPTMKSERNDIEIPGPKS